MLARLSHQKIILFRNNSKEDYFFELKWLVRVNTSDALANCARRKQDLEQNKTRVKVFWTSLTTGLNICFMNLLYRNLNESHYPLLKSVTNVGLKI